MSRRFYNFLIITLPLVFFAAHAALADKHQPALPKASSAVVDSLAKTAATGYSWFPDREIMTILSALLFFFLAFILIIYLRQPLLNLSDRHPRYSRILKQIISVFLIICWILIIYLTVQKMLQLSALISMIFLGIIGFAIALAFQDILKDVIAGLILPFQKHLEIGDKIGFADFWGEIIRIGLREVEIKKSNGQLAVLPARYIMKERFIELYSEKENCPVTLDFYLPIGTDVESSRQIAYKSAIISPYLFLKKPVTIMIRTELTNGRTLIKMTLSAFLQKIDFEPLFVNDITTSMLRFMAPDPDSGK